VNDETKLLEIESGKGPMAYPEAAELATRNARSDSDKFPLRLPFLPSGIGIGAPADNSHLYDFTDDGKKRTRP
jgi:hypothetical protein